MPYKVACPDCRATLMVPDGSEGKKIRCKKCEHVFPAPAAPAAVVEDILDEDERPRRRDERLQEKPRPSAPSIPGDLRWVGACTSVTWITSCRKRRRRELTVPRGDSPKVIDGIEEALSLTIRASGNCGPFARLGGAQGVG